MTKDVRVRRTRLGATLRAVAVHLRLDRRYVGLHAFALLRSSTFGDLAEVEARMEAMRFLLAGA